MSDAKRDELIELAYAALLEHCPWSDFTQGVSRLVPNGKTFLFCNDADCRNFELGIASGLSQEVLDHYSEYYANINPWAPKASTREVGRGVVADEMLDRALLVQSEFYNDFMAPNDCHSAIGVTAYRNGNTSFILSTLTEEVDGNRLLPSASVLQELAPHLGRIIAMQKACASANLDGYRGIAEGLNLPLLVADASRIVRFTSNCARQIMALGVLASVDSRERIRFPASLVSDAFAAMGKRGYFGETVRRFSLADGRITLIRVQGRHFSSFAAGPSIIVVLEAFRNTREVDPAVISTLYGLTPAEERTLTFILSGESISGIASKLGLSRETIRSQVKAVLAKTGTKRQAELVEFAARHGAYPR